MGPCTPGQGARPGSQFFPQNLLSETILVFQNSRRNTLSREFRVASRTSVWEDTYTDDVLEKESWVQQDGCSSLSLSRVENARENGGGERLEAGKSLSSVGGGTHPEKNLAAGRVHLCTSCAQSRASGRAAFGLLEAILQENVGEGWAQVFLSVRWSAAEHTCARVFSTHLLYLRIPVSQARSSGSQLSLGLPLPRCHVPVELREAQKWLQVVHYKCCPSSFRGEVPCGDPEQVPRGERDMAGLNRESWGGGHTGGEDLGKDLFRGHLGKE